MSSAWGRRANKSNHGNWSAQHMATGHSAAGYPGRDGSRHNSQPIWRAGPVVDYRRAWLSSTIVLALIIRIEATPLGRGWARRSHAVRPGCDLLKVIWLASMWEIMRVEPSAARTWSCARKAVAQRAALWRLSELPPRSLPQQKPRWTELQPGALPESWIVTSIASFVVIAAIQTSQTKQVRLQNGCTREALDRWWLSGPSSSGLRLIKRLSERGAPFRGDGTLNALGGFDHFSRRVALASRSQGRMPRHRARWILTAPQPLRALQCRARHGSWVQIIRTRSRAARALMNCLGCPSCSDPWGCSPWLAARGIYSQLYPWSLSMTYCLCCLGTSSPQ